APVCQHREIRPDFRSSKCFALQQLCDRERLLARRLTESECSEILAFETSHHFSKLRRSHMRATFLGKDPESGKDDSPTLYATDRTDRVTYIAQGWRVTDPQALADIGPVPDHETLIELPEDVLRFYARNHSAGAQ